MIKKIEKLWNKICYRFDPLGTTIRISKKENNLKNTFLAQNGFSLLKDKNINDLKSSVQGINLDIFFQKLKEKRIQDVLIEDGFKCLTDVYIGDIDYDLEGESTIEINNNFLALDNELEELKNLSIFPKEKKIKLKEREYSLKSLHHLFMVDSDGDKPEKGMIYLKLVNDYLSQKKVEKIAYLIHDTRVNESFGLCISNKEKFKKILTVFHYLEHLNNTNREKVIEIAKGEPYELRGFELLTNYHGYLIQEGPMIHVVE